MIDTRAANSDQQQLQLFVGGLASTVTNEDLHLHFCQFGSILKCEVQVWKNNPEKCRGFAIVHVRDSKTFESILRATHRLKGRPVECKRMIREKEALLEYNQGLVERKLFVSGLAKSVDDQKLREFFSQFGPLEMAYIIKHHKDMKSKGFGFVCFSRREDKEKALAAKELQICDKPVFVTNYCTKNETKLGPSASKVPPLFVKDSFEESQLLVTHKREGPVSMDSGNSTEVQDHPPSHQTFRSSDCVQAPPEAKPEAMNEVYSHLKPHNNLRSRRQEGPRIRYYDPFVGGDVSKSLLYRWKLSGSPRLNNYPLKSSSVN